MGAAMQQLTYDTSNALKIVHVNSSAGNIKHINWAHLDTIEGRMTDKVDEAVIVLSNFVADHKKCNKELTELKGQLTGYNKNKHKLEVEVQKRIQVATQVSLGTHRKSESEFKQKLKETEEIYINKIRALIQRSIEIKEQNEQLRTKLKMHDNETLQITMLEQQNNLLTERIALIEKCMDESERKKKISDDCIASLRNENKILENRVTSLESEKKIWESEKKVLDDRITSLENQNKNS